MVSLKLMETFLASAGYAVSKTRDGAQALEMIARQKFSLLITDVTMPRVGGLRLLEEVKKKHHIPAIVVTASDIDSEAQRKSHSLGALRFMIKPVDRDELIGAVEEILGKEPQIPWTERSAPF
jgi:DNA-binding NtrC family response regulator